MVEPLPKQVLDTAVDPAEIAKQSFGLARRGFDQNQVQQYLNAVADSLQDAQKREADMRTRLGRAVRRAETAEEALRNTPAAEAAELTRQVGDEVTSVLEAARVAADQRVAEAEVAAEKILSQANAEARNLRLAADSLMAKRTDEADLAAIEIVAEGRAEAQLLREQSRASADDMLTQAADRVERASTECDALISEAEEARGQILEDMERRRRQARAQVERLRVGRDRLLRSYEVVRRTLEETTVELKSSLNEAKVRGDGAARAINAEPTASRDALEAELRDAKMIGRITISDPAPPGSASAKKAATAKPARPRSAALPRQLDPPHRTRPNSDHQPSERQPSDNQPSDNQPSNDAKKATSPPTPRRPRVSEAMKRHTLPAQPKAPAVAPKLTPRAATEADEALAKDPIAAMMHAAEARRADTAAPVSADLGTDADDSVDDELAQLEDDSLNVIEPSDEIEEVVAMPVSATAKARAGDDLVGPVPDGSAPGLFAALREQRLAKAAAKAKKLKQSKLADKPAIASQTPLAKPVETKAPETATPELDQTALARGIEAQRDAVIAEAAKQLEKRLKRALADEQNDLLAGIRAAKRNKVALTAIVGDVDMHINRYVVAIHEVAAVTYGAGAALIDVEAAHSTLPAGAVEELLATDVVLPIRERLLSLDDLEIRAADEHIDPVRAFYRQRKTDHLGSAASRLANLLCVAGLCDSLPADAELPWTTN